ncbi:MAG: glycosyltransferase family 39 protein [Xanthomonadales bacterium]|nr:glycosyltransferase family 39 protein [Xanthomonadales bacterium]
MLPPQAANPDQITMNPATRDRVIVAAIALLFIATGIGLKDPWPSDEPRFALVAKEMVESGDWFFPTRGGELYPDKPPMFMWAQAVVLKLTGSVRVAHLLPSLLCSLLTLGLVYSMGRRLWDRRVALLACLLLLGSPQFVLESRAGQIDAMVTAWIALGVYGFLRHLLLGPDTRWLLVGFAASGFGIITKGVGFLPVLMFIPVLLVMKHLAAPVSRHAWWRGLAGVATLLGACAVWFVPMVIIVAGSNDPALEAYRDNILFKQTGQRYADPWHHFEPPWYFLTNVIPALWMPIFFMLPWLVPQWTRDFKQRDPRIVLLVGWVVLVITFFSISSGKRGVYILPALPWICLAAAPTLQGLLERRSFHLTARTVALLLTTALAAAFVYLQFFDPERAEEMQTLYELDPRSTALVATLATAAGLAAFWRNGPRAYMGVMAALWLTHSFWVYPRLDSFKSGRSLMLRVEQALPAEAPLALVNWKEQTILQARRDTVNFGFLVPREEQAIQGLAWLKQNRDGYILLQKPDLEDCFLKNKSIDLGIAHRRQWFLVNHEADAGRCG